MEYGFFYDIVTYGNEAWRGKFTQKEIACNAFDYWCEFQTSNEQGKATHTMKELFYLLRQDGSEEAIDFLKTIRSHANFWQDERRLIMRKDLEEIKQELIEKSEKEAIRLWRLARRARRHGCTSETVAKIREEADWCHTTGTSYPDYLVSWDVGYKFQYAFKI